MDALAVAVLVKGLPRDDEAAIGQRRHGWGHLVARRVCVDLEFRALRRAVRIVALAVDAIAVAVLARGCPRDDKANAGQARHRGPLLTALSGCVDAELRALGFRGH